MQISSSRLTGQPVSVIQVLAENRWVWCLFVVLLIAAFPLSNAASPPLGPTFGDTDDALRLVQIREFLASGSWYSTTLQSIGAPAPLQSHWSRLIDLPVAALITAFALFVDYPKAEMAAEIVWPLLLLVVFARFLVAEVERQANEVQASSGVHSGESQRDAGLLLLVLLLLSPSAVFQFFPGRIDHHNVQIMCAISGALLLRRAMTEPAAGWAAGAVFAVGLIVGYEALPLVASIIAVSCLLGCFDRAVRPGIVRALVSLAVALLVGHSATVHPQDWASVACDKLSLNMLGLVGAGAAVGAALLLRAPRAAPLVWFVGFGAAGVVGLALYVASNPVCAAGAFAGMSPIVRSDWLSTIVEGKSLLEYFWLQPAGALGFLAFMSIALVVVVRAALRTRSTADIYMATATVLAAGYGLYYVKFMPYGAALGLVPIALRIAQLPALPSVRRPTLQFGAALVCSQFALTILAALLAVPFAGGGSDAAAEFRSGARACMTKTDIAALSKLPPGLVVSDLDLGPFIALSTHHRVYAGPYHRIHKSIGDVLALQSSDVLGATAKIAAMDADYLVLCAVKTSRARTEAGQPTFSHHMRSGGSIDSLEPLSIGDLKGPLKVWKISRPSGG